MYSSIQRRLLNLIIDMTGEKRKNLLSNTYFSKDLGMDSKQLNILRKKIEDEFGIKLPKNILKEFETIGEMIGIIETEIIR